MTKRNFLTTSWWQLSALCMMCFLGKERSTQWLINEGDVTSSTTYIHKCYITSSMEVDGLPMHSSSTCLRHVLYNLGHGWPHVPLVAYRHFPNGTCSRADPPISNLGEALDRVPAARGLAQMPHAFARGWEAMLLASSGDQTCCASSCPVSSRCAKSLLRQR